MNENIEFRPSRRLVILLVAVHAAVAISCVFGFPSPWVSVPAGLMIALALFRSLRRVLACRGELTLASDGGLRVTRYDPSAADLRLLPASVVWRDAVWLTWRLGGRRKTLLLLADQTSARDWRTLQRWLRIGPGLAEAPEGDKP